MPTPPEDPRLIRLTKICEELPEVIRSYDGRHAGFAVGKKTFAWFLNDHQGDGIVSVSCKVLPGDNAALVAAHPKKFYLPAYMAWRGWVAMRLDVGRPNWAEVVELIQTSYRLTAPSRLARRLPGE